MLMAIFVQCCEGASGPLLEQMRANIHNCLS
jgi:hypothetical protein